MYSTIMFKKCVKKEKKKKAMNGCFDGLIKSGDD